MNTAIMKCWSLTSNQNGFLAPELVGSQLQGLIYDDSGRRFWDGTSVTTSTIRAVTNHGTHKVVETENTAFTVYPGDVAPDYEQRFPDAYEHLKMERSVKS